MRGPNRPCLPAAPPMTPLSQLVDALRDPSRYPHAVGSVAVIETHISVVLLAGDYAYKFKKPVDFGFLDFRSLEARRHYCEEELRLNRRTAPDLYLSVVTVTGTAADPVLDGSGDPIEFAVKMRRFEDDALLDRMAKRGSLRADQVDAVAAMIADFHERIERATADSPHGLPADALAAAEQNVAQMLPLAGSDALRQRLDRLGRWTREAFARVAGVMQERRNKGFVRECHGDLHLGNIAWIDGAPVAFDGIEFNAGLRWIDVMSEVAFVVMDLAGHGQTSLAWRCLDRYLEHSGDHGGMRVLRFHLVYRAMVRAKIAALRGHQADVDTAERDRQARAMEVHLSLAERLSVPARPAILITHGLSGSGKSTVAAALVAAGAGIRVRSDVERKRLYGAGPAGSRPAVDPAILYGAEATRRTYAHLLSVARAVAPSGWPVIVDAAFLRRDERRAFRALAADLGAAFAILSCTAPEAVLRTRVRQRARAGRDPSDADEAVLSRQLQWVEPLAYDETEMAIPVDTTEDAAGLAARIEAVAARFRSAGARE